MTRDDILKMEAGTEMDALIAEMMEWRRNFTYRPSMFIEWAWMLIEKLEQKGYEPCVNKGVPFHRGEWHVSFYKDGVYYEAFSWTAPLAICRAALLTTLEE